MTVLEKINELKGTSATAEDIVCWALMNKICPIELSEELEVEASKTDLEKLDAIAHRVCKDHECGRKCVVTFLARLWPSGEIDPRDAWGFGKPFIELVKGES